MYGSCSISCVVFKTMAVTVKFIGALRHAVGTEKLVLSGLEGFSVKKLLEEVTSNCVSLRKTLINPHLEDPRTNALILVNSREISVLDGLETELKDGDEVVLIPVVHGG